jgi:thymidylate synthase
MSKFESRYKSLLKRVITNGTQCKNRTGMNAITLFGENLKFDLRDGFPIITGRKIFFDKAYHEYYWIREGGTTTKYLNDHGITWWNPYAKHGGELGRVYGYQLRNFSGVFDQLAHVIREIKSNTRRAVITMWNPIDLNEQALPCCYTNMTFVRIGDELNLAITFRSSDATIGLPYDAIFAALLLIDVAEFTELVPAEVKLNLDNVHVYTNNLQPTKTYLNRPIYKLPKYDNFTKQLSNYRSGEHIETTMNV